MKDTVIHTPEQASGFDPSRRTALGLLSLSALAVVTGCGTVGNATTASAAATGSTGSTGSTGTTGSSTASCAVTPEGEEGPYFVADTASGFFRSSIVTNIDGSDAQTGIPLTLKLYLVDSENGCVAMQGVQVDIWHCNAAGVYSAEAVESTVGQTWLRGYQITDSNGLVTFQTIIPGWYQGRTTHIHLRLRSTYDSSAAGGTNTTQLFFSQALIDSIDTTASSYSAHGANNTTNASDHVYTNETLGENLLALSGDATNGYTTAFQINLPLPAATSTGTTSGR